MFNRANSLTAHNVLFPNLNTCKNKALSFKYIYYIDYLLVPYFSKHSMNGYDHTMLNTPVLVRSPKLSNIGPGQYLDGRPHGNTRCCSLFRDSKKINKIGKNWSTFNSSAHIESQTDHTKFWSSMSCGKVAGGAVQGPQGPSDPEDVVACHLRPEAPRGAPSTAFYILNVQRRISASRKAPFFFVGNQYLRNYSHFSKI